jgi:dihydrofolate reductase
VNGAAVEQAMRVSIVVAMAENRVIGQGNALPWRLPEDLKAFKRLTSGHAVVMGRKTFESIGKPLPQRLNIVISRQQDYDAAGAKVVASLERAMEVARQAGQQEVFIIGGEAIYRLALPLADRLYLTRVHGEVEGDVRFPQLDEAAWELVEQRRCEADERHAFAYTFERYERRRDKPRR